MKRLIIFLLLAIGSITFSMGQATQPMVVAGDMYINTGASMVAKGAVHVKAASQQGRIDNYGTLLLKDSIIFYSNDSTDGLLRNKAATPEGVKTTSDTKVVVRKSFNHYAGDGTYTPANPYPYTFSFPFNVGLTGGTIGGTTNPSYTSNSAILKNGTTEARLWDDYAVYYYDSKRRVATGLKTDNWQFLDEDTVPFLRKGQGYRIASKYPVLDFVLKNETLINELFGTSATKEKEVIYWNEPAISSNSEAEGWNVIGGLNTSSFVVKGGNLTDRTVTYHSAPHEQPVDVIYYWNNGITGTRGWKELYIPDTDQGSVVLSPYVTFFVQTDANKSFGFKSNGLSLNKANPPGFRSTENEDEEIETKDMFRLSFYKDDNRTLDNKMYIEMKDGYSEEFKIGEDYSALLDGDLGEESSDPRVWSWYKGARKEMYEFFVNRLPVTADEIKLGVRTPTTGRYTFELNPLQRVWILEAVLVDKNDNIERDLLRENYSFSAETGGDNIGRFTLRFTVSDLPLGVDEIAVNTRDVFAYSKDNVLRVKNLNNGDRVRILDLSGRTIASGIASGGEFSVGLAQKGVYLVNVKGEKNVALKVMNK